MALSLIFDGTAFFYIKRFKGLQAHPMKIFMWISFANFSFLWPNLWISFICNLRLEKLLQFTTIGTNPDSQLYMIELMLTASLFQITFFYAWVLTLNICLCLDLIQTFRNPFIKPESRYTAYIIGSILVAIIPAMTRVVGLHSDKANAAVYGWVIISIFTIYFMIAIFSCYIACTFLSRPGIS